MRSQFDRTRFTAMIPWVRVSIAQQAARLRELFPDSKLEVRNGRLIWIGELQPSDIAARYFVGIEYRLDKRPCVYVVEPDICPSGKPRPPHLYADDRLCLYYGREWNASMMLADTIVPWTSEWLFHYEIWTATGEWWGGGFHPPRSRTRRNREHSNP